MKKLLIGIIGDGTFGGVDNYILGIYRGLQKQYGASLQIDFLSNLFVICQIIENFIVVYCRIVYSVFFTPVNKKLK